MNLRRFIKEKELTDLTVRLVRASTENPPGNEASAVQFLVPLLSKMGFKVKSALSPEGRCNIIAEKRWARSGKTLIFNGHLDVVPAGDPSRWKYPPFQGEIHKGRIYGRGASDMKSGIAAFIHAILMIDRSGIRLREGGVLLHLVSDEESHGHQGTGFLARTGRISGDAALVGEPTDLQPVIAHKGALWIKISTFGKSAHGSRPDRGVNAVEKMASTINALRSMPLEKEHGLLGKPTFNIGMIRGGTKINIVPDRCEIEADRRMLPNEKKGTALREIKEILGSLRLQDPLFRYRMEEIDFAEPCEVKPDEEIVRTGVEAIYEVTGKKLVPRGFSGFTDARFYVNQCHIPTLIVGPGGIDQSHATDESVRVDALVQAAEIYALIILKFLSGRSSSHLAQE